MLPWKKGRWSNYLTGTQRHPEIEGADPIDQIHHWERMYRDPDYDPKSRRVPLTEFYSAIMPKYGRWLLRQVLVTIVFGVIASAAALGIKHALDHMHYQDSIIAEQRAQIAGDHRR